jgi:hypothetical protein
MRPSLRELVRAEIRAELYRLAPIGEEYPRLTITADDRYVVDVHFGDRIPAGRYLVVDDRTDPEVWLIRNTETNDEFNLSCRVARKRLD